MKNTKIGAAFMAGEPAQGSNLYTDGLKVFSYQTCIMQRHGGNIIVNRTKYSVTTGKQRNRVLCYIPEDRIVNVNEVPIGATDLLPYIK